MDPRKWRCFHRQAEQHLHDAIAYWNFYPDGYRIINIDREPTYQDFDVEGTLRKSSEDNDPKEWVNFALCDKGQQEHLPSGTIYEEFDRDLYDSLSERGKVNYVLDSIQKTIRISTKVI